MGCYTSPDYPGGSPSFQTLPITRTSSDWLRNGKTFSALHNNCSGKHSGMLRGCQLLKVSTKGYRHYDHPYQAHLRKILQEFFQTSLDTAPWGTDGCGIPTYALPLFVLAHGMARLLAPNDLAPEFKDATKDIRHAIQTFPHAIGGSDSFCTKIIQATEGAVLAKVGAEGVYSACFLNLGLGLGIKIEDGNPRAARVVLANIIDALGVPLKHPLNPLAEFLAPTLYNWTHTSVGQIRIALS